MASTINNISFGRTSSAVPGKLAASAADVPVDTLTKSDDSSAHHIGLGSKLGIIALGGLAVAGGIGLTGCSGPAPGPSTVQCTADPYQAQDAALLNHMATLSASPATGFNHAAGLYDASQGVMEHANELTRVDGDQALRNLSCGQGVRLYAPQTGWLMFHTLDQLHNYVGTHGMPWDMPGVVLGPQYVAGAGSPWYDSDYNQYNNYNAYVNGFYAGLNAPTWTYDAPPTYTPPSDWSQASTTWNQAPPSSGANWNQNPNTPTWNQQAPADNPPTQAPPDPSWNQGPQQAPAPSWNQAPTQAPAPSWNQNQSPTQAPPDNGGSWNQSSQGYNTAPSSGSWNQSGSSTGQAPPDF